MIFPYHQPYPRRTHALRLVNPNAPSGTLVSTSEVAEVAAKDEAYSLLMKYVDFSEGGCIKLIQDFDNAVVVRTMSKSFSSFAGMRIGFACASPELIAGMWKVKEHYNLNRLSLVAAEAALEDIASMRENAEPHLHYAHSADGRPTRTWFFRLGFSREFCACTQHEYPCGKPL